MKNLGTRELTCWAPNEYVVGRRGTALPADSVDDGYSEQKNGVRYDSAGVDELQGAWWDDEDTEYARYSEAWEEASYQAEIWNNFSELLAITRLATKAVPGGSPTTAYGYWDIDEWVRFSVARHFSVLNFKRNWVVPYLEEPQNQGSNVQQLDDGFCDCSPDPSGPCAAEAIQRLISHTGPRLRLASRGFNPNQTPSTSMAVRLWFSNTGNAPPLLPYQLELAFVKRSDFDPLDPGDREDEPTWPRTEIGPLGGTDLSSLLRNLTSYTVGTGTGEVDVRTITPPWERDPEVWADATTGSCPTDRYDTSLSYLAAVHGTSIADSATYTAAGPTLPSYCGVVSAIVCTLRVVEAVKRFEVDITTPSSTGSYVLLYRLKDVSTTTADKQVHMDLPHTYMLGDDTTQRWGFLGLVDVAP